VYSIMHAHEKGGGGDQELMRTTAANLPVVPDNVPGRTAGWQSAPPPVPPRICSVRDPRFWCRVRAVTLTPLLAADTADNHPIPSQHIGHRQRRAAVHACTSAEQCSAVPTGTFRRELARYIGLGKGSVEISLQGWILVRVGARRRARARVAGDRAEFL